MRRIRPQDRKRAQEPARCSCEGGSDQAKEHARPGSKAADHGNVFTHKGACIHSQLSQTTQRTPKTITVKRIRP